MSRMELAVVLCALACLGVLLFGVNMACAPFLVPPSVTGAPPPPGGPGCLSACMFVAVLPVALLPGLGGALLWWLAVRPRRAANERASAAAPAREAEIQALFDRFVSGGEGAPAGGPLPAEEWLAVAARLDATRQARLRSFLACTGAQPAQHVVAPDPSLPGREGTVPATAVRVLAWCLGAAGCFCLLWGVLSSFTASSGLFADWMQMLGLGPQRAAIPLLLSSVPGLTCIAGSLALAALLRGDRRRRLRHEPHQEQVREVAAVACLDRIARLAAAVAGSPPESPARRAVRASVLDTLAILDGERRARVLLGLRHRLGEWAIDLAGADLRGAHLAEADLQAAVLRGVDLSGADLREARASGADLRGCLLRGARLVRCDLAGADLRGADLTSANLFAANLAGADLRQARVAYELLRAASLVGTLLPAAAAGAEPGAAPLPGAP